jgi:hypothetical protein
VEKGEEIPNLWDPKKIWVIHWGGQVSLYLSLERTVTLEELECERDRILEGRSLEVIPAIHWKGMRGGRYATSEKGHYR